MLPTDVKRGSDIAGKGPPWSCASDTKRNGPRQVILIAIEDLAVTAAFLGIPEVAPELLRRNLVTRGINLMVLKDRRFRVGAALLEGSGECAPCGRMEAVLGPGSYNAVRGHGGITARGQAFLIDEIQLRSVVEKSVVTITTANISAPAGLLAMLVSIPPA